MSKFLNMLAHFRSVWVQLHLVRTELGVSDIKSTRFNAVEFFCCSIMRGFFREIHYLERNFWKGSLILEEFPCRFPCATQGLKLPFHTRKRLLGYYLQRKCICLNKLTPCYIITKWQKCIGSSS